ncbi:MAG TPA: hypothetical protein VFW07_06525 [Parafilimonas sp.]|nr:hypothetical protein [Parafilimonas sp.]
MSNKTNRLFNYKFLIAHKASSYPVIYSNISSVLTGKPWYANKHTDIVIDGFPRCANTYATYAFALVQGKEVNIAHHIHKKSQFLIAERFNIPAILLIRKPIDCVASTLVRQPKYSPDALLKGYFSMYDQLRNKNSYVVGEFTQVLNHYDKIIQAVNKKFGTEFNVYDKNAQNEEKVKEIIHSQDELTNAKDYKQRVAYPTQERQQSNAEIKNVLYQKQYEYLRIKCEELYTEIIQAQLIQ